MKSKETKRRREGKREEEREREREKTRHRRKKKDLKCIPQISSTFLKTRKQSLQV